MAEIAPSKEPVGPLAARDTKSSPAGVRPKITNLVRALLGGRSSPEETLASAILERVERELASVEERTDRLMCHYGL
jgi:hypothetical protein